MPLDAAPQGRPEVDSLEIAERSKASEVGLEPVLQTLQQVLVGGGRPTRRVEATQELDAMLPETMRS